MGNRPPACRPASLTFLVVLAFLLAAWNGLRLGTAFAFRETLAEYASRGGAVHLALSGAFWLVTGLAVAWGLWRGEAWGRTAACGAAAACFGWYWFDRLALQTSRPNWPFALAVSLLLLVLTLSILSSRKVKAHFRRDFHE